MTDEALVI